MANIRENKKNGKTVSYRFTACLGRDGSGAQIRKYKTWTLPEGLPPSRAKKAAEKEAKRWEKELRERLEEKPCEAGQNRKLLHKPLTDSGIGRGAHSLGFLTQGVISL